MRRANCLLFVLVVTGCASRPALVGESGSELAPSAIQNYELQLRQRIDQGEQPPVDVNDPNHQLVFCEGLDRGLTPESGYLSFGMHALPSITCQNTPDGERLLALRHWQCGDRIDSSCICGKRLNRDFFYVFDQPGYEAVEFGTFTGMSRREFLPDEIVVENEPLGSVKFGNDWDSYTVDSTSLQAIARQPAARLGLRLHTCRLETK